MSADDEKLVELDDAEKDVGNNNKKKCLIIIIVLVIILILGLAAFLIYFFILREKDEKLCEPGYYLVNDNCKPYSFVATYHNDYQDENIQLINENYLSYIEGMYMII